MTTFGVPAVARRLYVLQHRDELDRLLTALADGCTAAAADRDRASASAGLPRTQAVLPFVLGAGSNLLLARDLDEPVVRIALRGRHPLDGEASDEPVRVDIAAGESWHETVCWTLANGWYGLENLALIPGLAGAAPWQNIGAYGVEIAERIESVEAVNMTDGRRHRFDATQCGFGYRSSFFKSPAGRAWLILSVRLTLSRQAELRTGYGEIRAELARRAERADDASSPPVVGPREVAAAVEAIRRRKLPDPARIGNAGSFFKNPVIDRSQADGLSADHPTLPTHPGDTPDRIKLSAGWLIEAAGWKGYREGDAGVSDQHALVLVNHGRASGRELVALARRIQASVYQRFGVALEPEPVIIE